MLDDLAGSRGRRALDELVSESLVRPLNMKVSEVMAKHVLEVVLSEQDHPVEALGLE